MYKIELSENFIDAYGEHRGPAVVDAFQRDDLPIERQGTRPIVIQWANAPLRPYDLRIVSAGPNGRINIRPNVATSMLDPEETDEMKDSYVGDDIYVAIQLR
jgi:hypothetical protein